jgi:hypothetical protein
MVSKRSKSIARKIDVPAVDPEEMGFTYGMFQGALRGQLAAPDPLRRGLDFESDAVAEYAKTLLPEGLKDFFTVRQGR